MELIRVEETLKIEYTEIYGIPDELRTVIVKGHPDGIRSETGFS